METNHLLPASWVISDLGSKMKGRKFMCDLNNLRCLYLDMKKEGQTAVTFQCKYNNRYCFSCIFIADEDGKALYISSLGDNSFTLKVHVKSDFSIDKFGLDKETYVKLCEYLELKYNPDNPFIPREFIIQLDGVFPKEYKKAETRECIRAICQANNTDEGDKIYFAGWRHWTQKHTQDDNMEKSAMLVGFRNAMRLQKNNISSCWSADKDEEDLSKLNEWIDLLDE